MVLRASSYNKMPPIPRGIIREDGSPLYVCNHDHKSYDEARDCAKEALPKVKAFHQKKAEKLPVYWHPWKETDKQALQS
jgi:hypothetical protein